MFNHKNILIIGGTGTFGQRMIEILLKEYIPNKLVVYSRNELQQYEMQEIYNDKCMRYIIGDIRDLNRLKLAMNGIDYVVHTATLKNIKITEYNPVECVKTNVYGAENIIHAAIENNVKKVIALSISEAKNPTNLYESTILTSDKLFSASNSLVGQDLQTQFSVVRFTNSFEDLEYIESYFKKLVDMGLDPTLIEDIEKSKVFFTLNDGVAFVLKSFERMQGGEIFVQKISSLKLTELILSLPKKIQYEILDNSNHKNLMKKDLSVIDTTIEFDDHYVIKPVLASRNIDFTRNSMGEEGKSVKEFIPYGKQMIEQDDINSVIDVLKSDFLTTGPKVKEFEDKLAEYCKAKYVVAVSNGTAALHLASLVLLNKNDKVLTTPNSFLATSNSILYVGAEPIFVDIAEDGNIDIDLCDDYLKKDSTIKAIYGVAFSGNMLNQEKLKYIKETYGVIILEDCAHAIGAKYGEINAGSCVNSDCSIFSFHPVKHLTTAEGGAVTTNSKEVYEKLLHLRGHGMYKTLDMKPWEYEMRELGFNYRITDLQCALGITQLKKLNIFLERRFEIVKKYDNAFKNTIVKPLYFFDGKSSYHLYVVQVDFSQINISKEELFLKMREKDIGLQLHYIPINQQPYYKSLGYGNEKTPIMDNYYNECFSLPMFPKLTDREQEYVIESLMEVLNG